MSGGKFIIEQIRAINSRLEALEARLEDKREKVDENINSNLFERVTSLEGKYKAMNARMGKKKDD